MDINEFIRLGCAFLVGSTLVHPFLLYVQGKFWDSNLVAFAAGVAISIAWYIKG